MLGMDEQVQGAGLGLLGCGVPQGWGPHSSSHSNVVLISTELHVGVGCCHGDVDLGVEGGLLSTCEPLWAGLISLSLDSSVHT